LRAMSWKMPQRDPKIGRYGFFKQPASVENEQS
jgi:hypothetical protein